MLLPRKTQYRLELLFVRSNMLQLYRNSEDLALSCILQINSLSLTGQTLTGQTLTGSLPHTTAPPAIGIAAINLPGFYPDYFTILFTCSSLL